MTKFLKMMKKISLLNSMINEALIILPTPMNISYMWNFGSILGMFLLIQIISGFMLSMHYCPNTELAFKSIIHIMKNVNSGWIIRNIHMNGATFYFIFMYLHIARNIFYHCYFSLYVWYSGIMILFLSMATAFMGYVLPWGQMSFWGATVITNLLSAIPYIGQMFVQWIWGGFSINNATLNRFFSIHFILPFIILMLIMIHLYFLHKYGSSNPIGTNSNFYKIPFHPYFTIKDIMGFLIILFLFTMIVLQYPYLFNDPDNFIEANPMNTPMHIKPEWYFLFAYSILRAIPSKLGGVIALIMSIMILTILPFKDKQLFKSISFYPINQIYFWLFINIFILLTWLGGQHIEYPYNYLNYIMTQIYFLYFFIDSNIMQIWDYILYLNFIMNFS